jgi:hypothetical protein
MKQICNLVYRTLTDGMSKVQIAEFETRLADPKEKEEMIARQNAEAMKALSGFGIGPPPPPRSPDP